MNSTKELKLVSARIEIIAEKEDLLGELKTTVIEAFPDPAWTATLIRYLERHEEHGKDQAGAERISLSGSTENDKRKTSDEKWLPGKPFGNMTRIQ